MAESIFKFDKYSLKARIIPAVLTIVLPVFLFNHFFTSEEFSKFTGELFGMKIISNLTISFVFLFFFSQFARAIGKNVFEKRYFKEEQEMPTTNYLLFSNPIYSTDYTSSIHAKIENLFNIKLLNEEEENRDSGLARKKITEATSHIRKHLFSNSFLLQHNIEYGAMRNLIGGSLIGATISIFCVVFFKWIKPNDLALIMSSVLSGFYLLLILISRSIICSYGNAYAKILIREFMTV